VRLLSYLRDECLVRLNRYKSCNANVTPLECDLAEHFTLLHIRLEEGSHVIQYNKYVWVNAQWLAEPMLLLSESDFAVVLLIFIFVGYRGLECVK
jgi:hypothetical protein